MRHRLLIVEDEPNYRRVLRLMLAERPLDILEAEDGEAALEVLAQHEVDLVITDMNMPRLSGLELLMRLKRDGAGGRRAPPVIVATAYASIDAAVAAMQSGAIDYLQKPFDEQRLNLTLDRALHLTDLMAENQRLKDDLRARFRFEEIGGKSPALTTALRAAAKVAPAEAPVLVTGESGTGKELFARAIHFNSKRHLGPFVAVNCAAIPDGLLEAELFGAEAGAYTGAVKKRRGRVDQARGGTLFLDEIGDMALTLQAKLLRLLQEKTFTPLGAEKEEKAQVRFVFATHKDLGAEVRAGRFREDLLYRVRVLPIELPPLRERGDDIIELAEGFAARVAEGMGKRRPTLSPAARQALMAYPWPGNVRELSNVIERAVILADDDTLDVFDLNLPQSAPRVVQLPASASADPFVLPAEGLVLDELERTLVRQALARTQGNKSRAARLLGLTRATLRYRIERMGLDASDEDEAP